MSANPEHKYLIEKLVKDPDPLIPAGNYLLKITSWQTRIMFARAKKLIISFVIIDGDYAGVTVKYYCNVKKFIGQPKNKGRFALGKKSKFARQFFTVMESGNISTSSLRLDRLPLTKLDNIKANVGTITTADNKPIPKDLQYSVVKELIGFLSK